MTIYTIPREVANIANNIREMKIRGAGRIARAAAKALAIAASEAKELRSPDQFIEYLRHVSSILLRTRPTAVSLPNAVAYVMTRVEEGFEKGLDIEELKRVCIETAQEFIDYSLRAVKIIGVYGSRLIRNGARVLTHCNSSAAIETIVTARRQGKNVIVYATETRPRFQGYITAEKLTKEGIETYIITDSAVRYIMAKVDIIIVGADVIAANGALINKIGTSQIALAASEANVPFYTAAETYKFSPATLLGDEVKIEERPMGEVVNPNKLASWSHVKVGNPSFDLTPPTHITGIITEKGVIPPDSAYIVLRQVFGKHVEDYVKYFQPVFTSTIEEAISPK